MKFFVVLLLIGHYPDGKLMIQPIPDMTLMDSTECLEKAEQTRQAALASLSGFEDAQAECVSMDPANLNRMIQSLR